MVTGLWFTARFAWAAEHTGSTSAPCPHTQGKRRPLAPRHCVSLPGNVFEFATYSTYVSLVSHRTHIRTGVLVVTHLKQKR